MQQHLLYLQYAMQNSMLRETVRHAKQNAMQNRMICEIVCYAKQYEHTAQGAAVPLAV